MNDTQLGGTRAIIPEASSEYAEEELAALADGSLPDDRREPLEAHVAGSLDLAALLGEQRRAVDIIRGAAAEVHAPAGLRARVEAARSSFS